MLHIISIPVDQNIVNYDQNKSGLGHFVQYWHALIDYIIEGGNR